MYNIGKRRIQIYLQEAPNPGGTPIYWVEGYTEWWDDKGKRITIKELREPDEIPEPESHNLADWVQSMLKAMRQDRPPFFL